MLAQPQQDDNDYREISIRAQFARRSLRARDKLGKVSELMGPRRTSQMPGRRCALCWEGRSAARERRTRRVRAEKPMNNAFEGGVLGCACKLRGANIHAAP